jgi:hypothetical protein
MRRSLALLLSLLAVVGVACGDDAGTGEGPDEGGEVRTAPIELGDGDEVLLRVETGGGFVPMIVNLRTTPELLLFDDGRLVRVIDDEDRFERVVPRFEQVQLDESATAELLGSFAAVVDGPDPGEPMVTDLPSTAIEVTTDGDTRDLSIYALSVEDGLSDDEVDARRAAQEAIDDAFALDGAEPYVPEEWLVLTLFTGQEDATVDVWPLEDDRIAGAAEPAVCTRIAGDEVTQVLSVLEEEPNGTFGGARGNSEVALRPVLTDDEACNLADGDQFVER